MIKGVTVKEGEILDIVFMADAPQSGIFVMFFDGETAEDVNKVFKELSSYSIPSGLYNFAVTNDKGMAVLSFAPSQDTSFNIAIFSSNSVPISLGYTLYSSMAISGEINTNAVKSPAAAFRIAASSYGTKRGIKVK